MSCCNENDPTTQAKECDAVPGVYECPDDGTYLYNLAKRLRWFSSQKFTAECADNFVGDAVTAQASVTSSISQADANAQALLRAEGFADASLACQPLFWSSTQSYLHVCPDREDLFYAATVTAVSWLNQAHADAKAYGIAYETVQRIINCCVGGPFEKTISFTATCTTGPSSPFAEATAEVTASSCISELNAWQIAENEAKRAAQLALTCDYPDWLDGYFTSMKRCDISTPIPEAGVDPCNRVSAALIQMPPVPPAPPFCPVCLLYLRQCGQVIGIINVGCTLSSVGVGTCNYPPGTVELKRDCIEVSTPDGVFQKCNIVCILDIPPNNPPGCEPCGSGFGLQTFLFGSGLNNDDCNVLGFYCCGKVNCAFGFCECYSPCCLGDLFCVEH